jgi:hypothetical protein
VEKWTEAQRRKAVQDYLNSKAKATPTPKPKPPVKKSPPLTVEQRKAQERARIKKAQEAYKDRTSPSNMTPEEKWAFMNNPGMSNY